MGIYGLKPAFRRSLAPLARRLGRVHPDAISYAAVAFAAVAGFLLFLAPREPWLYLVAPILLLARIACNALDGMVAQAGNATSARGELVNEISDRASDTLIFAGLALSGAPQPALAWGALVSTLLVSYLGILPKAAGGKRNYAGPFGKADRMLLLGIACVLSYALGARADEVLDIACIGFIVLALVTAARRWSQAWRELEDR